jgi:hypothetical protein
MCACVCVCVCACVRVEKERGRERGKERALSILRKIVSRAMHIHVYDIAQALQASEDKCKELDAAMQILKEQLTTSGMCHSLTCPLAHCHCHASKIPHKCAMMPSLCSPTRPRMALVSMWS